MNVHRLTTAILTGALVAPAGASGHVPEPNLPASTTAAAALTRYTDQRTTTDPTILAYRDRAIDFWTQAGYPPPCVPTFDVARDLDHADGRAWWPQDECRIAVLDRHAGAVSYLTARRTIRDPGRRWQARWILADFCAIVTHELGHVAGLAWPSWTGTEWQDGHPATPGVMSNVNPTTPRYCRQHARLTIRRPR